MGEEIDYAAKARSMLSADDASEPEIVAAVIVAQAIERAAEESKQLRTAMDSMESTMREFDYNQHMRFVNSK